MKGRRRVVVTGACGRVGSLLAPALAERYDAVLLDAHPSEASDDGSPSVIAVDLSGDRDSFRHHFDGADAVVHCAFRFGAEGGDPDAPFRLQIANLTIAHNIYRVSLESGVRRLVMCSTNHVADYYEDAVLDGRATAVDPERRPLSRSLYGWAQEASEHLGFVFALGHVGGGRSLENVQIRIGTPCDIWPPPRPGDEHFERRRRRWIAACVSRRDLVQLFVRSIEAPDIRDANGVPFQIFYGISRNEGAFWSIANAVDRVGYDPQDNGEQLFKERAG